MNTTKNGEIYFVLFLLFLPFTFTSAFTYRPIQYKNSCLASPSIRCSTSNPSDVAISNTQILTRDVLSTDDIKEVFKVEKFARLPVWPAWNGVFIFIMSRLFGNDAAARLENSIGGRVCPNFFQEDSEKTTSPFIMLVHHRHSFAPWDILRFGQKTFFPEGFPAHPHRGFATLTYCLQGGMIHRDSMGVKQSYGAEKRHKGRTAQWLTAGAGMLHEEMWDVGPDDNKWPLSFLQPSSQELYQIWVNLPSRDKMLDPTVKLMRVGLEGRSHSKDDVTVANMPSVTVDGTETIVVLGSYRGMKSDIVTSTPLDVLHIRMSPGSTWSHEFPDGDTGILYIRQGSVQVGKGTFVECHHTAYLSPRGSNLKVTAHESDGAGKPINERVVASGSMVMNTQDEIDRANADYQNGWMGSPWNQELTDLEWKDHIGKFPSIYDRRKRR